jgi:hypothetical protein
LQTEAGKQAVRLVGVTASSFAIESEEKNNQHAQLHLKLK